MKQAVPILIAVAAVGLMARMRRRRRAGRGQQGARAARPLSDRSRLLGSDVALVASREVRERLRSRVFRAGTLLVLAGVAAAIVIPAVHRSAARAERVGIVGALSPASRAAVVASARSVGTTVRFVAEPDEASARADLRAGLVDLAVVGGRSLVVDKPVRSTDVSTGARFALAVARQLGVLEAFQAAQLSPAQAAVLAAVKPLPIGHVEPGPSGGAAQSTSLIGLVLVFVMLSQYNTWTLIGVMEEKSSRVIEVLLSAVRPIQLLSGKVLGIGLVAVGQASLVVAVALLLARAVGSDLLHGTAPVVLVATLAWLLLGYAFYSWLYAAAGSLAERQDQIQSLAVPLSLPMLFGYIMAFTAVGSGSPSLLVRVLAYLPPTAPFEMPVLVGLGAVNWWEFAASTLISVAGTVAMARLASAVYRRAVLQTGGRARLRGLLAPSRPGA